MYTYQRNYRKIIPEHEKVYHDTTGEKHKFLGDFYTLSVQSTHDTAHVVPQGSNLVLAVNDPKDKEECAFTLDMWYRDQAQEVFLPIVADAVVETAPYKVALPKLRIYRMLDRWGSCSPKSKILIMNLELIKVPVPCIEYIATHEMLHFRYPSHNFAFSAALGTVMPDWKKREDILNEFYPI